MGGYDVISRTIHIEKYGWCVRLFVAVDRYYADDILGEVEAIGASQRLIGRMRKNLIQDKMNTGFTYSNKRYRKSVVVVGKASSAAEEMNSITHELRHLVDDIASEEGMKMGGEEVAYLTGDIALKIFPVIQPLLCDHCRKH